MDIMGLGLGAALQDSWAATPMKTAVCMPCLLALVADSPPCSYLCA